MEIIKSLHTPIPIHLHGNNIIKGARLYLL